MDETLETRRISASIFGNEKLAEIVLLLDSEDGAVLAADLARRTGFSHSLVRDVLIRLGRTSAVRALPKTGNPRGPAYYEKDRHSPLWPALVALARAVATAQVDAPLNHNQQPRRSTDDR
jgi:hypothetical protein